MTSDAVARFWDELKNTDPAVRLQGALGLKKYATSAIQDLPAEAVTALWETNISRPMASLLRSKVEAQQLGGLLAIEHLVSIEDDEVLNMRRNLYRLWNNAKEVMHDATPDVLVAMARTAGKIADIGHGTFGGSFMEHEVPATIDLLSSGEKDPGRFGGVLLLQQLARSSPTQFFPFIPELFAKIHVPLCDPKIDVRAAAAQLLGSCLDITTNRDKAGSQILLENILSDAHAGLRSGNLDVAHGSLLTLRELLLHAGMFMRDRFMNVSESILKFRSHKDSLLRRTVMALIPELASYDTQTFCGSFLANCMSHLLEQLKKSSERPFAFIAIGHVALSVKSEIKEFLPFLAVIMDQVRLCLLNHGKKGSTLQFEDNVFDCVSMLTEAAGPHLAKLIYDQLPLIFSCGLSDALFNCLVIVSHNIPFLHPMIQERLLDLLSKKLIGQPYRPLGTPPLLNPRLDVLTKAQIRANASDPIGVTLALQVLGTFDLKGHILSEFVREAVLPYLEDENSDIRLAAATTTCVILRQDPIVFQTSNNATEIINEAIEKLLIVGVADSDANMRLKVLQLLDEKFDKYLAQAEHVRAIFMAINDEVFDNRLVAIRLIGRLCVHNPAYVMPWLRKALIQLVTELQCSPVVRDREDTARLLTTLTTATQPLIKSYALSMLTVLLPKASDQNISVATNALTCLGELSTVGGEDFLPYVPQLMGTIISILNDPASHVKRESALKTLGQICANTSYVIDPLVDYPKLLPALNKILDQEPSASIRREVIRVLGILGAVDPYRRTENFVEGNLLESDPVRTSRIQTTVPMGGSANEEYYQSVVFHCLLGVLSDQSLATSHHTAVEALMSIFKTQGLKAVGFLPQIIPVFISVITTGTPIRIQEFHLQQLAILVDIVKQHIRNFLPEIIGMVNGLWSSQQLHLASVKLVEALARALDTEFRPFLPPVIPLILSVFNDDFSEKGQTTQMHILRSMVSFGANLEEYLHLIIPVIIRALEAPDASISLRRTAVQTIDGLTRRMDLSDHASRLVHPLTRSLAIQSHDLRVCIMDTLCVLLLELKSDFAVFIPLVAKSMRVYKVEHEEYTGHVATLMRGERLPVQRSLSDPTLDGTENALLSAVAAHTDVNQQLLQRAWSVKGISSKGGWSEWFRRVCVAFIKASPSPALRACVVLLETNLPVSKELSRDLFNIAFLSCWTMLYEGLKEHLSSAVEAAIRDPQVPAEVAMALLNLAEFMEHQDCPLQIVNSVFGDCAMRFHAYAKALHYKELDFFSDASPEIMESLININTRLQQHDAAFGILTVAREQFSFNNNEEWYERLGHWQDALVGYTAKAERNPDAFDITLGRMRCLHALGEWDALAKIIDANWIDAGSEVKEEMAPLAAAAAWALDEWDAMDDYTQVMSVNSPERSFFRAVLAVHRGMLAKAQGYITRARDLLDLEFSGFVGENYVRNYNMMVRAQMLSELEEIILFKQSLDNPDRKDSIRTTWTKRLLGCQPEVEVWQRILQVRAIVLSPGQATGTWLKFANLCRKSNRLVLADKTINSLIIEDDDDIARVPPSIIYSRLKYLWAKNERDDALSYLSKFLQRLTRDLGLVGDHPVSLSAEEQDEYAKLLARCYLKQAEWTVALVPQWLQQEPDEVITALFCATQFDPSWYKAWHLWALYNNEVVSYETSLSSEISNKRLISCANSAIKGLFQSISLSQQSSVQDVLRLLTLWFKFGVHPDVSQEISSGCALIPVDTWIDVIPQIIARVQTPNLSIRENLLALLHDIGKAHPQALIYSLTVAAKSPNTSRRQAGIDIMEHMRLHSPKLVEQAKIVGDELIRVAILWHELWHDGLEEASKLYFTEKNPEGMIVALEPLHEMIENGATTTRELSFEQTFGRDLKEARESCRRYRVYGETRDLEKAWELYYSVWRKVDKQLPQLTTLDLQHVSPALLQARDLILAVPGSYQANKPVVRIQSFMTKLTVISSKQRPRKLSLKGSDGQEYDYLLKGHEDLRQDERVMQFLGLVNTLLSVDHDSYKRRLHVQRYPVIPLAPNAGLIRWVQETDTFHVLIRDYRESRKILLNIENRLMIQMAPEYELLTLLQKVEVFQHAMDNTTGQDLYRVLWLKSTNSEHWLERRTTYTRSLAVTSMVGYVLGLGDRHPSNILIARATGKIVHIDFGDCFEVAMHRDKFPEKVPFRLTRMMIHAMEVSGIRGSYKNTCDITMLVLRNNRESLLAVLEAFIYDPLISWRLTKVDHDTHSPSEPSIDVSAMGQGPARKLKADERDIFNDTLGEGDVNQDSRNRRALAVYSRVQKKLTGLDFSPDEQLSVKHQVEKLILQATSMEALCQHFPGWCACW